MKREQKISNYLLGTRINFFSVGASQSFQSFYSESGLALGFLSEVFLVFGAVCKTMTRFHWFSLQCNYGSSYGPVYWCSLSLGWHVAKEWSDLAPFGSAVTVHPAHWLSSAFPAVGCLLTWILILALHVSSVGSFPAIVHAYLILVRQVYSAIGTKEFCSWV